jgi:hypothetical protein
MTYLAGFIIIGVKNLFHSDWLGARQQRLLLAHSWEKERLEIWQPRFGRFSWLCQYRTVMWDIPPPFKMSNCSTSSRSGSNYFELFISFHCYVSHILVKSSENIIESSDFRHEPWYPESHMTYHTSSGAGQEYD